jgi:dihydrofolate reductase
MCPARPIVSLIVAMSRNRVIGRDNAIPWHLPGELKRFKELTLGHHIVMGRRTWDSIGRLLPGRTTIIVTRNPALQVAGALMATSLPQALKIAERDDEIFVIGGEEIFRLALPLAHRIYLTTVDVELDGDTFMPVIDAALWRKVRSESHPADAVNPLSWVLEIYERVAAPQPEA